MSDNATLDVFDADRYGEEFYIAWVLDGDEGGMLGQDVFVNEDLKTITPDDWDHVKASIVAAQTEGVERKRAQLAHGECYVWPSKKLARQALRAIRSALKDRSSIPWPDWAVKAKAAGWTPPTGWSP